jgi:RNA-binding protein 39
MGLPIKVQHTEAERNRTHAGLVPRICGGGSTLTTVPGPSTCPRASRKDPCSESAALVSDGHPVSLSLRLYVGSLHFNLTENDVKQVFEPFGELEFVDLHRDQVSGRSKGYAFVQSVGASWSRACSHVMRRFKRGEDARMALEQMEGFELAGRRVRDHCHGAPVRSLMSCPAPRQHGQREGHHPLHGNRVSR